MNTSAHRSSKFLNQSLTEATLGELRRLHRVCNDDERQWRRAVVAFLKADADVLATERTTIAHHEIPNLYRALRKDFRDWRLTGVIGPAEDWSRDWCPVYERIRIRPGVTRRYATEATLLYELPGGERRVLDLESGSPNETCVRMTGLRQGKRRLDRDFRALLKAMKRRHYLRGQVIGANGRILRNPEVAWDQIALPTQTKQTLLCNIQGTLDRRGAYQRNNVPQRRGILLYGPPGTGKTMIGKAIASLRRTTFLWVTAADVKDESNSIRLVFQLARTLRPTILFFEDIDFFAGDREQHGHQTVLGELLTQMDGLESNNGIIVMATTNDLESIEPALKDRPSRFDVVLQIGLPSAEARRAILARQLDRCHWDPSLTEHALAATEGMSGARVRELAILTLQEAIFRGAVDENGVARPALEDVQSAAAKSQGKVPRPIGFSA